MQSIKDIYKMMLKMFGTLSIYKPINHNQYLNLPIQNWPIPQSDRHSSCVSRALYLSCTLPIPQPTYPSSYLSLELEPSLKLAHPSKSLKAKAYPSPCYSCPLSVPTSP